MNHCKKCRSRLEFLQKINFRYTTFSFIESFCINNRIRKINWQQKINTKIFFQSSSWLCNKQSKGLKNDLVHWVLFYLQLHHLKFISWGFWCGGSGGVWNWVKWAQNVWQRRPPMLMIWVNSSSSVAPGNSPADGWPPTICQWFPKRIDASLKTILELCWNNRIFI